MKTTGSAWAALIVVLVVIGVLFVGIFGWYISGYNRAVNLDEAARKAWQDVDVNLQRRLDLVPNLVETVKGYAEHEKELFENIAKSREKYFQARNEGDRATQIAASSELGGFLSRLWNCTKLRT